MAILDKVDVKALKDQYHVLAAFKNGPRLWPLDWIEVEMGIGAAANDRT